MMMSTAYEQTGRASQKRRTRMALVAAARDLVTRGGQPPTVGEAAEEASVSRTTAYRYFPTQKSLLLAAHPEVVGKNISLLTGSVLFQQERERKGGLIDVQVKPTKDLMFDLSAFSSRVNATNVNANFMFSPYQALTNNWSGDANSIVPSAWEVKGDTIIRPCRTGTRSGSRVVFCSSSSVTGSGRSLAGRQP